MEEREAVPSNRSKVRTMPRRGSYDKQTIFQILDATFICHVGFNDGNNTFVIPVVYGRKTDRIYFHGGKGSRMLKTVKKGMDICITVTSIDGLVLARSAFHHSVNYRSVVAFGRAEEVVGKEQKRTALKAIMDHMIPGRWEDVRQPNDKELNATTVLSLDLNEASAKVRTGPANDEEEDMELPVWAGVIPLNLAPAFPEPDEYLQDDIRMPTYLNDFINEHKNTNS